MSTRIELESITRQWISLWCAPVDWDLFERLHAEAFEDCSSAGRPATREGFAQGLAEFIESFPDLQTRVEGLVVDDVRSQVAVRWAAQGTNRAAFLGNGPTQRLATITGIEIIEIRDGQVIRRWGEWDNSVHPQPGS